MSDLGSYRVQSKALRDAAKLWDDCSRDSARVARHLAPAVGQGDKFGVLAGSYGVSGYYNTWISAMHTAAQDAATSFDYLDAALTSTANAYDGADDTSAASMERLDRMIEHG